MHNHRPRFLARLSGGRRPCYKGFDRKKGPKMGECADLLEDNSLFRNLSDEQSERLEPWRERIDGRAGRILCKKGEDSDCFWVIAEGKVSAFVT